MPVNVSATYTRGDHAFREKDPYARAKYDLTMRWLIPHIRPGETLYHVGVGSGYFNHLATHHGLVVEGCEPDPAAFDAAVATAPPNCRIYPQNLEEFAFSRKPARLVVMHDVLEHIEDDIAASGMLRQLVKGDGLVVLSVPALMSLYGRHDEELGHYRRYTASRLRRVLQPHFNIERLQWYGLASIPIAWYFSRWRRQPYPNAGADSLAGAAYARLCSLESYIPEPIGTSLIGLLTPRA